MLDFVEFTITKIGPRSKDVGEILSSPDVHPDDWVFEKSYAQPPPGPPGSLVGGIPNDVEDTLFLLRLWKPGDIAFIKQAVIRPSGNALVPPNRVMNDLNSYARRSLQFEVGTEQPQSWSTFAGELRQSQSWNSDWLSAAKRFFLSGGAKPFRPESDDVDRIVDYATALESTLVPEKDYNTRRISRRAGLLISPDNPAEADLIADLVKRLYDIRSRIVHGGGLRTTDRKWLLDNYGQVESRVRQTLVAAVQKLPPAQADRRVYLAALYDPTDEDRANAALDRFREIKSPQVRKATAARIAQLAED